MQKAYSPINWEDYPSEATPINEDNLNRMDSALNEIDNRVLNHDNTKANTADVLTMIADVSFDETKGVFTFTRKNGSKITLDTKLEKIAINWSYDALAQVLIITLDDGTKQEIPLSALVNEYDFDDTDTIAFTVIGGEVTATVKDGSINENHLRPNYLADVKLEVANAQAQAQNSATFAGNSSNSATKSESYAHGGTGTRENEDTDNAKYYYEQAKHISQGGNGLVPLGTIAFENLPTQDILANGMYNISNDFVSDERFVDGGGVAYGKGSNVYYTATGYWDVLAASSVTGVRGSAETSFRQGNVTLGPQDLGLGEVLGDIAELMSKIGLGGFRTVIGVSDCNDIAIGYSAYCSSNTTNAPNSEGTWQIFCYGVNSDNRIQIGFNFNNLAVRRRNGGTWSEWKMYLSTSGGTMQGQLYTQGLLPNGDGEYNLGWPLGNAWKSIFSNKFEVYKDRSKLAELSGVKGTAETTGGAVLVLGNNIPQGQEGNAISYIQMYGYGSGYTRIYTTNNNDNINVMLPKTAGTLMLKENIYIDDDGYVVIDFDK